MTHRIFFQFCVSGVASLCISMTALAQPCAELTPSRTVFDQKGGCLALVPIGPTASSSKILIVMLHGDGGGQLSQAQITRWTRLGETLQAPDRNVFFMLRPGYQSPAGNSSGWANPRDDDYTALNMERVAGALRTLRDSYKSEKLILIGHSGGAATSSIVLGKHPGVADAALLLGCPCDVPPWRDHRNAQRGATGGWPRSLNPLEFIAGIPAGTPVLAVTGAQDDNTLPTFARRWVDAANAKSAKARFVETPGLSHSTILQWPDIASSVSELVEATLR
jgi:pimeloyl-ACP methyl ester carboxylesterase